MSTVRTDADNLNWGFEFAFEECDIILESLGELVLAGELRHIGLPSGQLLVDGLDALLDVVGEVARQNAIHLVSRTSLDGGEVVEHVALHHDELGDAIHHNRIAQGHEVNPTTTALTTCDGTILVAKVANLLARLVEELCGERTSTHTCAVSLHDAEHLANLVGTNAQARAGTSADGVRRGHKGIAAEVDVEHRALSTFAENALARTQHVVDFVLAVDNGELAQILHAFEPFLFNLSNVVLEVERLQDSLVTSLGSSILLLETIEDIAYAQTIAADFVGIGWTNALTRGTHLVLTLLGLVSGIEHAMSRHDEVSLLRDMQTLLQRMTTSLQRFGFVHKQVGSQHHAITDDVDLTALEDTRGYRAQHILLALELECMASVRTALETGYHIILRGQHVDHLTFSFVAPLQTEQDINFTLIHSCEYLNVLLSLPFAVLIWPSYVLPVLPDNSCRGHRRITRNHPCGNSSCGAT